MTGAVGDFEFFGKSNFFFSDDRPAIFQVGVDFIAMKEKAIDKTSRGLWDMRGAE